MHFHGYEQTTLPSTNHVFIGMAPSYSVRSLNFLQLRMHGKMNVVCQLLILSAFTFVITFLSVDCKYLSFNGLNISSTLSGSLCNYFIAQITNLPPNHSIQSPI